AWGFMQAYEDELAGGAEDLPEIVVAILDDGFQVLTSIPDPPWPAHPDLADQYVGSADWYDYVSGDADPSPGAPPLSNSTDNHGTAMAGIVAAEPNNSDDITGLCWHCKILPIRTYSSQTSAAPPFGDIGRFPADPAPSTAFGIVQTSWIVDAIERATDRGADIILMAWTLSTGSTSIDDAIYDATTNGRDGKGVVVVTAVGNGGQSSVGYPASHSDTIAVGASNECDRLRKTNATRTYAPTCDDGGDWGSNYGTGLDLLAPGVNIYTLDRAGGSGYASGDTATISGTSNSSAIVAGVAGLLLGYNTELTYDQVLDIMQDSGVDVDGYKRVDADAALTRAENYKPATLISPKGETYAGTPTFKFEDQADATWFLVKVIDKSNGSTKYSQWFEKDGSYCVADVCTFAPTTSQLSLKPGQYEWGITFWNETDGYFPEGKTNLEVIVPDLISPAHQSVLNNVTAPQGNPDYTFEDLRGNGVQYYQLWIGDNKGKLIYTDWYKAQGSICNGFSCTVNPADDLEKVDLTLGNKSYRWWLRVWGPDGYGPWISADFSLNVSAPAVVTLIAPNPGQPEMSTRLVPFDWEPVPQATWYYLWVNDLSTSDAVFKKWYKSDQVGCYNPLTSSCSTNITTSLDDGDYKWWIRPWGPGGYGPWGDGLEFEVDVDSLATPSPISPIGAAGDRGDVVFKWTHDRVPESSIFPTEYFIWSKDIGANKTLLYDWHDVEDLDCSEFDEICSFVPPFYLKTGSYQWAIQAYQPDFGKSAWFPNQSFSVEVLPTQGPNINSVLWSPENIPNPLPEDELDLDIITYQWPDNDPDSNATWYQLWISDSQGDKLFSKWYQRTDPDVDCNGTRCLVTPELWLDAGQYSWWVLAWNPISQDWSEESIFTVKTTVISDPEIVYPKSTPDVTNPNPAFQWFPGNGLTRYTFWLNDSGGKKVFSATFTATDDEDGLICEYDDVLSRILCTLDADLNLKDDTYKWWVQGLGRGGTTPWVPGPGQPFTVSNPIPGAPTLVAPEDGTIQTGENVVFQWEPVQNVDWYLLSLNGAGKWYNDTGSLCDYPKNPEEPEGDKVCQVTRTDIAGGDYEWTVQSWTSLNGSYDGGVSDPRTFTRLSR
ncbi:MAG: S8 family serine peptidase, partial [Chloroflexi bacterium]|nr:S8 family serine peptidase [Chloroflexota bacterium]